MAVVKCAECQKEFESEGVKSFPFCSRRCQNLDLGRWMDERYGLPVESNSEESPDSIESEDQE